MIELSVPSKTFLVGEYAVLRGAPALVVATQPVFEFRAEKTADEKASIFHPDSAAGTWFRQSEVLLRNWKVEYKDPHHDMGGFGASGAQFIFYHALTTFLQSGRLVDDVADVWQDYKACERSSCSGADVVAQTLGAITFFRSEPFEAKGYDWPFDETDFFVLRTGQKLATHSHVAALPKMAWGDLIAADHAAIEAFFAANVEAFAAGLARFQKELQKLGLQSEPTLALLEKLNACPGVIVTKGCGAMGAETLLAIVDRDFHSEFYASTRDLKLDIVASTTDLVPATQLKVLN